MRAVLAILAVLLVGGCATDRVGAVPVTTNGPAQTSSPPGNFVVDPRFPTVTMRTSNVVDAGLVRVAFRLVGNCTFAEGEEGSRELLVWPEGHVRYDSATGTVWFLRLEPGGEVVTFTGDNVLDLRVTPFPRDRGYVPLKRDAFVVPPDPSCPDTDVSLVTGVKVR